jgi:hypothetical protein
MTMPRAPERPAPGGPRRAGHLAVALVAALLAGCDGTQTVDGILAPSALSGGGGVAGVGGAVTVTRGIGELLGSWVRVAGSGTGVLVEQTFTFAADGSGQRTTITRTAFGAPIAIEQAPFRWNAGGGILQLRFIRQDATDTVVRASYVLLADVASTVLRLDGTEYVRVGS